MYHGKIVKRYQQKKIGFFKDLYKKQKGRSMKRIVQCTKRRFMSCQCFRNF